MLQEVVTLFVTPQQFGAVADGIADDSEALQKAVDSGFDVYIPTGHKETYRITKTIRINRRGCKRFISDAFYSRDDTGCIIADFTEQEDPERTPLFDLHVCGITFGGIRFISQTVDGDKAGILFKATDEDICDYDIRVDHCGISAFYRVADMQGRGLEFLNSQISRCQFFINLYWDDEFDTNENHPPEYDQRAIAVKNCRLHHIQSRFLDVKSGHAYGLHFHGNTIDNGSGFLLRSYEQAWGWNITGNVIQGVKGNFDFMDFRQGMLNCVISGNTFLADKGYWIDTTTTVRSWLKCGGNTVGSVINNNVFKNSGRFFLSFNNIDTCAVNGNVFHNVSGEPIIINGTEKGCQFVGNA